VIWLAIGICVGVLLTLAACLRVSRAQSNDEEEPIYYQLTGPTGPRIVEVDDETEVLIRRCNELRLRQLRVGLRTEIAQLEQAQISEMMRGNKE